MITALNQQIWQIEKKFSLQFSVETVYSSDPSWMRSEPFLLPRHHLTCNCSRGVFNTVLCFQCSVWDLFATLFPPPPSHYLVPALPLTSQCCFLVSRLMQRANTGLLFPGDRSPLFWQRFTWGDRPSLPSPSSPRQAWALAILPHWDSSTEACKISCRASPAEASGHSRC